MFITYRILETKAQSEEDERSKHENILVKNCVLNNDVHGVERLLRLGYDISGWNDWLVSERVPKNYSIALGYMFTYYKKFLPDWSPQTHKNFPREFRDIAVNMLVLFKRLNVKKNTEVCPDMRKMLLKYAAHFWRRRR